MSAARYRPKVGLILGSGSARGWAHIGVINELNKAGIHPDIVCGTSIGALVGGVYASGHLDELEKWVTSLGLKDVVSFMDLTLTGGVLKGERLMAFFREKFKDSDIETLEIPFGAVATSLYSGAEIWLRSGSMLGAVRASIALPALFAPVRHNGQILVDGGLVNPVPVSLARAMGADILIAVDLNSDLLGRHLRKEEQPESNSRSPAPDQSDEQSREWVKRIQNNLYTLLPTWNDAIKDEPEIPSVLNVVASSINIMQERITRSRMVGEPPHIIIAPRLAHLGLLDFHRAEEAIEAGAQTARECIPAIKTFDIRTSV
ncbi:MAG TPA: patatin-like phospholipase RssA [Pusillimonas sp.]|jgi:NTE family protein|nr:patatin [Pusillimonas sp.]MBC43647.1 patatin [Pusillimonas sp.]HBT32989.1 patatin-like phospholipase RssA [Pusillimonas sp.]|tara:strand:+ start:66549 stop:67499 length:951 start_codon:yes stop_codon:yes gene_type:complete